MRDLESSLNLSLCITLSLSDALLSSPPDIALLELLIPSSLNL